MSYTLPDLPYDYAALEPHISGQILELHHDKHHAAYVAGANTALDKLAAAREAGDFANINKLEKDLAFHLGGHLTKQTLEIITAEEGSDMRHSGLYFTERDEHLDLFTADKHEAGHTTGDTVWKGALTGESRASYEGLIHIVPKASETHTYLQTHSMLLSQKAKGDAIPSLIVEVDNVSASHGGTVGELDEEQIFYMETRGIPRAEAVRVLVAQGYEVIGGSGAELRKRVADAVPQWAALVAEAGIVAE